MQLRTNHQPHSKRSLCLQETLNLALGRLSCFAENKQHKGKVAHHK
jgi:hypothetical protein